MLAANNEIVHRLRDYMVEVHFPFRISADLEKIQFNVDKVQKISRAKRSCLRIFSEIAFVPSKVAAMKTFLMELANKRDEDKAEDKGDDPWPVDTIEQGRGSSKEQSTGKQRVRIRDGTYGAKEPIQEAPKPTGNEKRRRTSTRVIVYNSDVYDEPAFERISCTAARRLQHGRQEAVVKRTTARRMDGSAGHAEHSGTPSGKE